MRSYCATDTLVHSSLMYLYAIWRDELAPTHVKGRVSPRVPFTKGHFLGTRWHWLMNHERACRRRRVKLARERFSPKMIGFRSRSCIVLPKKIIIVDHLQNLYSLNRERCIGEKIWVVMTEKKLKIIGTKLHPSIKEILSYWEADPCHMTGASIELELLDPVER